MSHLSPGELARADQHAAISRDRLDRVLAIVIPTRDGTSYEVIARDLIGGVQIKHVRNLTVDAALAEANRLLKPL